ncbi:hypothetical protein ACFORL_12415 [Legionella dresdenensis]|uniref:Glycosyl transferase family 1 domain-containing protein n=1 Tax=Legionella dresdenensis TaxID=450200 RepID=A0ABV8CHT2_9GAMM
MAICLFTRKCYDGSGDLVQTVKIADFIQKFIESTTLEELKDEAVIIVVNDDENQNITNHFVKFINPNVQVKNFADFKEENHTINCCIEAGYSHFDWKKDLIFKTEKPPLIVMPEYDNHVGPNAVLKILGGFDKERGDVGVIPSPTLLAASAGEVVNVEVLKNAFEQLDPKLQLYLGKDFKSYLTHREQREFTYQYSHDRNYYPTFYTNHIPYKPYQYKAKTTQGAKYTPVEFFLQEHLMLAGNYTKSQDVLCIGECSESKIEALVRLKEELIKKGYTKISFINMDEGTGEHIIHEINSSGAQPKEYRVLYSKSMPFSSMQVLPLIATDMVGVTGDQSLVEAMSAKKLVTYECVDHKQNFARGYLKAVQQEASVATLEGTSKEEVLLLARFLIKPTYSRNTLEYKQEVVSNLLNNRNTVEALKNINRQLVVKSQYFASIEKMLVTDVLSYIKRQNTTKLNGKLQPDNVLDNLKSAFLCTHEAFLLNDITNKPFPRFRRTRINKELSLKTIIEHGMAHDNRTRKACFNLGWLSKKGNLAESAPTEIKKLFDSTSRLNHSDEQDSFEQLRNKFLSMHFDTLFKEKSGFFSRWKNTEVKPDWDLKQIIKHGMTHDNRTRAICVEMGWLSKKGELLETVPDKLKQLFTNPSIHFSH